MYFTQTTPTASSHLASSHSSSISRDLFLRSPFYTETRSHETISTNNYSNPVLYQPSTNPALLHQQFANLSVSHSSHPSSNIYNPSTRISSPFFILADSHGRHIPSSFRSNHYDVTAQFVSGLSWLNPHNSRLCAKTILLSSALHSILSSSIGVLFIIGTNSVRSFPATDIIAEIEQIIHLIRSNHPHLVHKQHITLSYTYPCYKPARRFPSLLLLANNVNSYNNQLHELAIRLDFSLIDFHINGNQLSQDGMHLAYAYRPFLYQSLINYLNQLANLPVPVPPTRSRSRHAITRRNERRQQQQTLIRIIHRCWQLKHLKLYLKEHKIKYSRLPEIYNHKLRIRFNHTSDYVFAAQLLDDDTFNEINYINWLFQLQQ
uniref:GDSL esterase/lipase n=1 Tax=Adineta vaga TaxID=104782 RepID=A0A1W6BQZ6_ADIVA|nr:GDSL esterase/lipase [Adineta vaga]